MDIINWGDFRRGTLAILLVIIPTVLLSNFIEPVLQSHQITGPGLWQLKLSKVPDTVIEPLHVLRLKPYFFKFRLMNEIELRIADPALFKKYKKKIESQITSISMPAVEYIFLVTLAAYYWILWFSTRKYFPDGKV